MKLRQKKESWYISGAILLLLIAFVGLSMFMTPANAMTKTSQQVETEPELFAGSNWTMQWYANPDVNLKDIQAVDSAAQHLRVVGSLGLLYYSDDGGQNWGVHTINDSRDDLLGVYFLTSDNGFVIGGAGDIFHTVNGGTTWQRVVSGSNEALNKIQFVDANDGWIVGEGGTILATTDGGQTWITQTSGISSGIDALYFVDALHGWVVSNATILATTDGGQHWTQQRDEGATLNSIAFSDLNDGWAVGEAGTVLHTTDGGATWSQVSFSDINYSFRTVVIAPDGAVWIAGAGGKMYRSDDGVNFIVVATGYGHTLTKMVATDADNIWCVGSNFTLIHSSDRGTNWDSPIRGGIYQFYGVSFGDDNNGWVGGQASDGKGVVLHSADGGKTWGEQFLPYLPDNLPNVRPEINGVRFVDSQRGVAIGRRSVTYHTSDGGKTWVLYQIPGVESWLKGLKLFPDGFGVTSAGFGHIYTTKNFGESWQTTDLSWTGRDVVSVRLHMEALPDRQHFWGVGPDGIVVSSINGVNGGWARADLTPPNWLYAASFVNAQEGWAVGAHATIWHTTTGGRTKASWTQQSAPGSVSNVTWLDVKFLDDQNGIVVGGHCPIARCTYNTQFSGAVVAFTHDGGKTWLPEELPDVRVIFALHATDQNNIWLTGDYGVVLKYIGAASALNSFKLTAPLTVDGNLQDWPAQSGAVTLTAATAHFMNSATIPDAADISGVLQTYWTDAGVYFGVHVNDNTIVADGNSDDDAVILGIDGDNSQDKTAGHDHLYKISAAGKVYDNGVNSDAVQAKVQTAAHGYDVELFIPTAQMTTTLVGGQKIGFDFGLQDNDGNGIVHYLLKDSKDPATPSPAFGKITLVDNHLRLQHGLEPYGDLLDTYLNRQSPNANYSTVGEGNAKRLRLSWDNGRKREDRSALFGFDLSFLPSAATVTSATLKTYVTFRIPSNTSLNVAAYGITRTWDIDSVTWNAAASGTPWGAPGANDTTSDRLATPADRQTLKARDQWYNFDLASLAPQMNGGDVKGVLLRPEGGNSSGTILLAASEMEQFPAERPILDFTYDLRPLPMPTATPTPTTTATPTATPTPTATATPIATPTPPTLYIYLPLLTH